MDDALATVRWVAGFDFPDLEVDHEFLALTDPDRYAIERGVIRRGDGITFAAVDFTDHVVESQVPYSTALHATLDGKRYLTGPLARYTLNSSLLSPVARRRRPTRDWPRLPEPVPQHRGSRGGSGVRRRGGLAHHRRLRTSRETVQSTCRPVPRSATA